MALDPNRGSQTPQETTNDDLMNQDRQPTAFKNMDTGSVTPHGDSMHDEGKTTPPVNRAAEGEPETDRTQPDDATADR